MALIKKIVTPAGNTLGNFGVIISILAGHMDDGLHANMCVVAIFNSEEDAIAEKPPVVSYRYQLGNTPYAMDDLSPIYKKLLATSDQGKWAAASNAQQNVGWVPGWENAQIVDTPKGVGLP